MSTPAPVLVVPVADVARRLRLPQPLDEADLYIIEQAILDAQTDLMAYLGRPILPQTFTEAVWALPGVDWTDQLTRGPIISIVSTAPETDEIGGQETGRTLVTYTYGLDSVTDPALAPIRRFVTLHAMYSPTVLGLTARLLPTEERRIRSAAVEGQSVTYDDDAPAAAGPGDGGRPVGSLPTFSSCDDWRVRGRRAMPQRPPRLIV